jgi:phospholipase/lecithinase/hemolysin
MRSFISAALPVLLAQTVSCGLNKMENLVLFGDSYSDEGRLGYFINHNGSAPPAGEVLPASSSTASGGVVWGRFIAQKSGAKLIDYAVGGATCSNKIVERDFSLIHQPFPSVTEYQIPAYEADLKMEATVYSSGKMRADNTVFGLWIGTNDLGAGAILTDANAPGTTISSYVDCIWNVFDSVYKTGGRHFVLLNTVPLELSPMYNVPALGGTPGDSQFWQNKTAYNVTEYKFKIKEYTTSVNTIFSYGLPFQSVLEKRWKGATVQLFDVHSLFMDIIAKPDGYLTAPANVSGYYHVCNPVDSKCVDSPNDKASFLWYDELHPSERAGELFLFFLARLRLLGTRTDFGDADEIVAEEFIKVVADDSKYGKTYT